jgi:Predicted acetyltransferase involved in intracellular survival and related acetyltransferases
MITPGENQHIPQLKKLWELCFPKDSRVFIDFYFDKVYRNEAALIYLEEEKVLASFLIIPYPIKNQEQIKLAGYISGAMTHPDYRGIGIMSKILEYSFVFMQEKGYEYSFLIPQEEWLFDYYARFGYERAFPSSYIESPFVETKPQQSNILRDKTIRIYNNLTEIDLSDFFITYSRFLTQNNPVILKTKEQLSTILEDLFDEKGNLFTNDWGVAFCLKERSRVLIKEFFYFDQEIKHSFLSVISDYFQTKQLLVRTYYSSPSTICQGMIKSLTEYTNIPTDIYMSMMLD